MSFKDRRVEGFPGQLYFEHSSPSKGLFGYKVDLPWMNEEDVVVRCHQNEIHEMKIFVRALALWHNIATPLIVPPIPDDDFLISGYDLAEKNNTDLLGSALYRSYIYLLNPNENVNSYSIFPLHSFVNEEETVPQFFSRALRIFGHETQIVDSSEFRKMHGGRPEEIGRSTFGKNGWQSLVVNTDILQQSLPLSTFIETHQRIKSVY
jgi:hypothetical protein